MKRHTWQSGLNSGKSDASNRPAQPLISCPECGSARTWRDGLRHIGSGSVQRWTCRDCGYRFSEPSLSNKKADRHSLECRVCETEAEGSKNLATVETRTKEWAAGATTDDQKSLIVNFAWHLKKNGYRETTIEGQTKLLRILSKRGADLRNPENVKDAIARQNWSEGRKENAVNAYSNLLKMIGGTWIPPRYRRIETLPWIPTETEVDQLVAGCSPRIATFLQLLKETGMRPGETWHLKWTDVDSEKTTINVTPEKNSRPRIFKISGKLDSMLKSMPKDNEFVFGNGDLEHFTAGFRKQRRRIAFKLKNPRLKRITFKTLRHFKATMEYQRTRDILHVMKVLGHKNIKNTLVYTQLVNFESDEFISKVAKTTEEACAFVEAGFDYVCDFEGIKIFKKRK